MARLPRLIGRSRALEVLLGSEDIDGELAESYGYVNRALPDAELDAFVDAFATRIARFDKWAISNTKRLVNAASLAPEVELAAGWEACIASVRRPSTQERFKAFRELGWHKPGDAETQLEPICRESIAEIVRSRGWRARRGATHRISSSLFRRLKFELIIAVTLPGRRRRRSPRRSCSRRSARRESRRGPTLPRASRSDG